MSDVQQLLSEPLAKRPHTPLRVAVYSRLAEGIRKGVLPRGSLVPPEVELGAAMGVSRTVVRESLMLLEEDGLIQSKRGVGRFVATTLPAVGLERIVPVEQLFATGQSSLHLRRLKVLLQPASEFTAPKIGVQPGQDALFWESLISRDDDPIAHIQETIPARRPTDDRLDSDQHTKQTMLGALLDRLRSELGPGSCAVSVSTVGPTRAEFLDLADSDPVLVLTETVQRAGLPFYHAKCVVAPRAGHVSVAQPLPA